MMTSSCEAEYAQRLQIRCANGVIRRDLTRWILTMSRCSICSWLCCCDVCCCCCRWLLWVVVMTCWICFEIAGVLFAVCGVVGCRCVLLLVEICCCRTTCRATCRWRRCSKSASFTATSSTVRFSLFVSRVFEFTSSHLIVCCVCCWRRFR